MHTPPDFAELAKRLVATTRRDLSRGVKLFEQQVSGVAAQIRQDASRRGPLSFWGRSRNVDEITGTTIVDPGVLRVIAAIAGKKLSERSPHAGLQHTYGYLFSTIETPFGFKRDRWLETEIESAFGLDLTTLSPCPRFGTLLSNATWLAGRIAFRSLPHRAAKLQRYLAIRVAPELVTLKPKSLNQIRLTEQVTVTWRSERRKWTLQTDLVESITSTDLTLLVYSVIDHYHDKHQLITLFPVGAAARDELLERGATRRRVDIRARFNAYIPALAVGEWSGRCRLKEF
jgi:hypothetical protein